jgi:hypothetical protein
LLCAVARPTSTQTPAARMGYVTNQQLARFGELRVQISLGSLTNV